MPLFRAELNLAREETDANGNLLLTSQETRRARAELKQVKSASTLAAAQAALAGFRQALEQARSNEFKDASVAQKTDATAHTVQKDALRHEIAQLEARLNFFAGSGKPLAGQPMTAAEIASARGHIEAAQTLYRKYQEGTPGELTGEEVGLVRAALLGSGTVAALMGRLKSASVGADALVNLPASVSPDLVRAVWRADLEVRVGETVTVDAEVRQRFTKLEAQQLREQLSAVWNAAKSGGDVASLYSAYAQAVGNLSANTATEVRYESGLTAYTDAESRRIRDAGREFKRIAEARGTSHADAIAAHQRYVDTVTEARANGFVRETVTQLDGAVAPADALALLRARIAQMRANLDYFGNHSAPADRLTATDVSQARGLLDRAEFLLKVVDDNYLGRSHCRISFDPEAGPLPHVSCYPRNCSAGARQREEEGQHGNPQGVDRGGGLALPSSVEKRQEEHPRRIRGDHRLSPQACDALAATRDGGASDTAAASLRV
jgi:hypothetical protein